MNGCVTYSLQDFTLASESKVRKRERPRQDTTGKAMVKGNEREINT